MLFNLIIYLPDDIIKIIWEKIAEKYKIFINKKNYIRLNYLIDQYIHNHDRYMRDIIRNDYAYVFYYMLQRHFNCWLQRYNYRYNSIIYTNYIDFILFYSQQTNSSKCKNLINLQFNLSKLKKEWYKNNRIKYNKWSN